MIYLMMIVSSLILRIQATDSTKTFSEGEMVKYYSYRMFKYYEGVVTIIDPLTIKGHDGFFYEIAKNRTLDGVAALFLKQHCISTDR